MNAPEEQPTPTVHDALPVAAPTREIEPSGPVWEGELVEDAPTTPRRTRTRRFLNWWQRSRHVPAVFKSWPAVRQGGKDAAAWLLRSPFRFAGSVFRGLVVCVRA